MLKEEVGVARVCPNQEALKMLMDQPTSWRASKACSKAHGAVGGLDFDKKGAKYIDAPACARFTVLFPYR